MPQFIGPFEVIRPLGRGGMGIVYLAKGPDSDNLVAVKVLPHHFINEFEFRARFDREAKAVASLAGAPVVPIYDFGQADGEPYIVMPYLTGGSLADRLRLGVMPLPQVLPVLGRLVEALDLAHSLGIIHRDLKSLNVLFDDAGLAYLADFGLVKLREASTGLSLTGSHIIGTPSYMSPEQGTGRRAIDHRTDIYSLGVLLYEMLSGRLPFGGDTPMQVIYKHVMEPIPPLEGTHLTNLDQWNSIISCAMAKEPDQRYPTAGALLEDVMRVAGLTQQAETALGLGRTNQIETVAGPRRYHFARTGAIPSKSVGVGHTSFYYASSAGCSLSHD
jgi:eukaryotic-like serine/threonine-protein kinase